MSSAGTTLQVERRHSRWKLVLGWVVVILIGTSWPRISVGPDVGDLDKVVHFAMYATLAALATRSLAHGRTWGTLVLIIAAVAGFGVLDELHQSLIPGRSASLRDWYADSLGAIAGTMLAHLLFPQAPERRGTAS